MPITTTKLIRQYRRVCQDEAKQRALPPSRYLRELIVESLSHTERAVYHLLANDADNYYTSEDVSKKFELSLQHALNLLNHLHQYGLVTKARNTENAYRKYLWSIANHDSAQTK